VVGSRWRVGDGAALAILMFMFHHFMAALGQSPVDALRSAQLWMLDPGRAVPDTMPEELAGEVAVADDDALTGIAVWGAFAHHGA
jgi:CHAT domain-containing protein